MVAGQEIKLDGYNLSAVSFKDSTSGTPDFSCSRIKVCRRSLTLAFSIPATVQ